MNETFPHLTLVLGGAASGKSALAETLCATSALDRVYVATAQAHDAEMAEKIERHKRARGTGWTTVEAPFDVVSPLAQARGDQILLVDCLTLWLTNHLLAKHNLVTEQSRLLSACAEAACPVVMVSNEVGLGIVPADPLSRTFRAAQGRLNQRVAAQAGLVVSVTAGLPQVLKGRLPEGVA